MVACAAAAGVRAAFGVGGAVMFGGVDGEFKNGK